MNKVFGFMSLLTMFATLCLASVSAMAQGGGTGGGGTGGSSGGGSGGGGTVTTSTTITMSNALGAFNGVLPQGTSTFVYTKNLLPQSLDIQVSNVNVPNGTVIRVQVVDALRVTGRCWHYDYLYYSLTISNGKGSLSFSAIKGDFVPILDPKKGFTQITVVLGSPTTPASLTALLPFKGIL